MYTRNFGQTCIAVKGRITNIGQLVIFCSVVSLTCHNAGYFFFNIYIVQRNTNVVI